MIVISSSKEKIVLKPQRKDENWKAFIFDINIIPLKPTPKKIVIQKQVGRYLLSWSMSWKKFLKETCIDSIVILNKSSLTYKATRR